MNKALINSLTEAEWLLIQETEPAALAGLDEDALLEVHTRVQRARSKYVKQYRRGASSAVADRGGRGLAYAKNQRARDKAEAFEIALAQVSAQVAKAARQAAAELRADRIAAARASKGSGPQAAPSSATPAPNPSARRAATKTTGGTKRDASSQAQGTRRQAARDAR